MPQTISTLARMRYLSYWWYEKFKWPDNLLSSIRGLFEFALSIAWLTLNRAGDKNSPIVLCELHKMRSLHVAYFYFVKALWLTHGSFRLVGFTSRSSQLGTRTSRPLQRIRLLSGFPGLASYKAMGMARIFLAQNFAESHALKAEAFAEKFFRTPSLEALEALEVEGALVGDLIYDEFLRVHNYPTIDIGGLEFRAFFVNALARVFHWVEFFSRNDVAAIISTDVYMQMVPGRIGLSKGVDMFVIDWASSHTYRLTADRPRTRDQYREYPQLFQRLPSREKEEALLLAAETLNKRLSGAPSDPLIPNETSWSGSPTKAQLKQSNSLKILIAAHDFSDSPHNAIHFYPDFYRWLEAILQFAAKSRHDWYIKTHRDASQAQKDTIQRLLQEFPAVKLVDPEVSHQQLIEEGVSLALTVLGTIGVEYAWMGLPVINATTQHTHMGYSFNVNPSSREEYEDYLESLEQTDSFRHPILEQSVAEYFFMHRFYNRFSLFFRWPTHEERLPVLFHQRLTTPKKVRDLYVCVYRRFIESGAYWMNVEDSSIITAEEKDLLTQHMV